jgi:PPOX class probable F420-dependent enzyme
MSDSSDLTQLPEQFRDLLDAPIAVLATLGSSGHPQLSAVWFLVDGGQVAVSLNDSRQKTQNLRRNPACTLMISDPSGYRYIEIRGDAEFTPDPDYQFADRVGAKYDADLRQMDQPGEQRVVVRLRPVRVRPVDMTAGG